MKLLNDVIQFGKAFGKLTQISQIAVVVALLVVAFSVGNCNGENKLDTFIVQYEELKENAKKATQHADSLNTVVTALSDTAKKQEETIKKLTITVSFKEQQKVAQIRQLAQLEERVRKAKTDTNLTEVVTAQDEVITNLKTQVTTTEHIVESQKQIIQSQEIQVMSLQRAVTLATARGDTLQKIIDALPKTPKNPDKIFFGLIPKPNRTVVGIVALATGVVVGSQIGK